MHHKHRAPQCRRLAEEANATSVTYDVVFYGDSLTGLLVLRPDNAAVFEEYFGSATGWNSARLGVGGSDVEELTWRLMVNGEKLAEDPLVSGGMAQSAGKAVAAVATPEQAMRHQLCAAGWPTKLPLLPSQVIVVLIGINNELDSNPAAKLDVLLSWMAAAMPRSKILVVTPLPSVLGKSGVLLTSYRVVVRRHPGVTLSTCGSTLNPRDDTLFTDGLHLTPAGYREYFSCLKPQLEALRKLALAQQRT